MLINQTTRKYISEHIVTFIVILVLVGGALVSSFTYVFSKYEALGVERIAFERDKTAATIDIERKRLEVERRQSQLSLAIDGAQNLMEQAHQKEQQLSAENQRIQDAINNIQLWRQKLSPEQEYRQLVDEFTQLSVDLNRCVEENDRDRHARADILAKRIWFAAAQTNSAENMTFAKSIQPISRMSGCPSNSSKAQ